MTKILIRKSALYELVEIFGIIEKSIDTNKCTLEMTTDCNGNVIHRWIRIADDNLLNEKLRFANAVKQFVERNYTQNSSITVLSKTPNLLKEYSNMPDVKITVEPKILRKILLRKSKNNSHNHNIPIALLKDLPIQLNKPMALLKDLSNNHIIVIVEQFYKKRPVIAAIEVSKNIGGNIVVNSLRSYHDKRVENFSDFFNKKKLLYTNKKKDGSFKGVSPARRREIPKESILI